MYTTVSKERKREIMARERMIPKGYQELRRDDIKVVIYFGTNASGKPSAIAYSGRRSKADWYNYFGSTELMENKIATYVKGLEDAKTQKEEWQAEKKATVKKFKESITVGTQLRTTFSYNMTFNDFYEVLEIKGAKVKLAELQSEWVSGDAGYTGQVACTSTRTGKLLEARFSTGGLKIDGRSATLVEEGKTYYENHLD